MDQDSQTQEITGDLSFREVADRWTVPLMVLDRDLCFVYANKAYLTATNTEWASIRQKYIFEIFPDVEERQDPVEAKFRRVFEGVQTRLEAQPYDLKQPDGTVQTRMWQAVQDPYRNDDGVVTHMIQRAEDITAQMELQRQNDFMQNELAHRIRNMFSVIMATSRISGESAESVDTFVDDFNERLVSMSRVYSNLTRNDWTGLSLRKIMIEELDGMLGRGSERYTLKGNDPVGERQQGRGTDRARTGGECAKVRLLQHADRASDRRVDPEGRYVVCYVDRNRRPRHSAPETGGLRNAVVRYVSKVGFNSHDHGGRPSDNR